MRCPRTAGSSASHVANTPAPSDSRRALQPKYMPVSSTCDAPASGAAPPEGPGGEATEREEAPASARPRRRPTEVHSITQLTTDEIVAELDRRERRTRQLLARQEALRGELADLDQQLADIGDSLPALEAAARALPAGRAGRAGGQAAAAAP